MSVSVAALIATYQRPRELERLLVSLARIDRGLTAVIVVDNAGCDEIRALVERAVPCGQYVNPGANLGCGGGLRLAAERALQSQADALTHLLILDDDTVLAPDTIASLATAMQEEQAELACPMVIDEHGHVGWLPGVIKGAREMGATFQVTPPEFRTRFGTAPRDFTWTQGICLLVAQPAVAHWGPHRGDFWVRGEDLEFSLRLTAHGRGIFVPTVVVEHLPPPESNALSREAEYWKHCALVQNIAYVGFRLPHGRRIAWTIAGALRRFFRLWSWAALGDALRALWRGAIRGQPAGAGAGPTFRVRFETLHQTR